MATVRGTLGQVAPLAMTLTTMYTVPLLKSTVCRVIATETGGVIATFRISIAVAGAADSLEQYIAYNRPIAANDTGSTIAFIVNAGDMVRVFSSTNDVSFTLTGIERDN